MRYITPIIVILLLVACPKPDEDVPIPETNPQINIPWPSLGDTPWPMHHHDPQSTGRSQYAGPQQGVLYKKVPMTTSVSGMVLGDDSNVLAGCNYYGGYLESFDYEGNLNWQSRFHTGSTPIVGSDGIIYAAGFNQFSAFTQDGDTVWTRPIDYNLTLGVNIDMSGNLYFIDEGATLNVLDKDGELLWQLTDNRFWAWEDGCPTFSPDGNILYVQGRNVMVLAVDITTQNIDWTFGDESLQAGPVVDNAGNLYFVPERTTFTNTIYSINNSGQVNWEFDIVSQSVIDVTEVTIDYKGNIYFATDTLYSLTYDGELRWKVRFEENVTTVSGLVCDLNNTVYVGAWNAQSGEDQIMAVDETGELLWIVRVEGERLLGPSPAIAENGTMFFPTWNNSPGKFLIIK